MRTTLSSHQIAARRGVGAKLITRDAPAVDLELDLTRASGEQLETQRLAIHHRLGNLAAGDDLDALTKRATAVMDALTAHNARVVAADEARSALAGGRVAHSSQTAPAATDERGGDTKREQRLSPGQTVARSEAFQTFTRGTSGVVEVPLLRAAFTTEDYPSQATRVPGIREEPAQPMTLLDLVDRQTITTNNVEWVQELEQTNSAREVAEGGLKPESTWSVELKSDTAATIAHWTQMTRQALSDEGQVRGYLEGKLRNGLLKRLNGQILNGNGTAPNLRGILATSGIGTYVSPAGEDPLISIRKARTVAELSEYAPDAVAVHPTDWEAMELSVDDNGRFRAIVSVADGLTPRVWGLLVISTTNLAQGTAVVGGFREGATLWEREGVQVYVTDSHADTFLRNIITMLAEMRAVLSVWRPKAFVRVTFTPAAP